MCRGITFAEAKETYDKWGANCGPGALSAITGASYDRVRGAMVGFEAKGYTNPSMMFSALENLNVKFRSRRAENFTINLDNLQDPLPCGLGLIRVQWEGPWMNSGVPLRARYRFTHWIGCQKGYLVFDINATNDEQPDGWSGWLPFKAWSIHIVPSILLNYPKSNGKWHFTHVVELL